MFPILNDLKQKHALLPLFLNFALGRFKKASVIETEWETSASGVCWWY
jgi:hypothetical protein